MQDRSNVVTLHPQTPDAELELYGIRSLSSSYRVVSSLNGDRSRSLTGFNQSILGDIEILQSGLDACPLSIGRLEMYKIRLSAALQERVSPDDLFAEHPATRCLRPLFTKSGSLLDPEGVISCGSVPADVIVLSRLQLESAIDLSYPQAKTIFQLIINDLIYNFGRLNILFLIDTQKIVINTDEKLAENWGQCVLADHTDEPVWANSDMNILRVFNEMQFNEVGLSQKGRLLAC